MNIFSPKIVLIFVLFLAVVAISSFIYFSNQSNPAPLPIPRFDQPSPTPVVIPQIPYEQLAEEQKKQAQDQSDEYYQKTQDNILKKYPWYFELPIKDSNYFVDFDASTEVFTALVYPQRPSSTPIDQQVEQMKQIIIQRIGQLGADTGKYQVKWEIIPE